MAGTVKSVSVEWPVHLQADHSDTHSVSRKFPFGDREWFMISGISPLPSGSKTIQLIFIKLHWGMGRAPEFPIGVSIQVRDSRDRIELPRLSETGIYRGIKDGSRIWCVKVEDVERADYCFSRLRKLTFKVTLEDIRVMATYRKLAPTASSRQIFSHAKEYTNYDCLASLSADLSRLLGNHREPDVRLLCGGYITRAHKNILCSRSPVLAEILQSNMIEGRTGELNIRDMSHDTLREFLSYIYTGKLRAELTLEAAMEFYKIGDMYEVRSFSKMCSQFLVENLDDENAWDILVFGDAQGDSNTTEAAMSFVSRKEIPLLSDRWSNFCNSHPIVAKRVLDRYHKALSRLPSHSKELNSPD